ncbi:hypothetical protein EDD22DRAFT_851814 [Suillus occidentalis]|nr:hypothetical protein EDD22DRAFT_851814 [Suillus occidentalis]
MDIHGLMAGLGDDHSLDRKLLCGTRASMRIDWRELGEGVGNGWMDNAAECHTLSQEVWMCLRFPPHNIGSNWQCKALVLKTIVELKASGKDKSNIYAVLAKLIFANHAKYGAGYQWNPKKFCDSVANHIVGLKARYKKLKARLGATGAGVLPGDKHTDLLLEICVEWKWFADLDFIWHSNPAFAVASHSSRPGVDHAGQMYVLAQPLCGATAGGTSPHDGIMIYPSGL